MAAVKETDGEWKLGGTGTGQEDSLVTAMLEKEFGIEHTYLPFKGGGRVAKNRVGGHINSTVNNPSEQLGSIQAGKPRLIAAFTAERIGVLPDVPTMTELGHDMVYTLRRSFVAPAGIPEEAVADYTAMFEKLAEFEEWQTYATEKALQTDLLTGDELQADFLQERQRHKDILSSMGEIAGS